jgi:hypothetical protein
MTLRATIQNQKNSTLTLFQPAEIVLNGRQFETKINGETSSRFHIQSVVPQGSILGPPLYVLYTSDLPTSREITLGTFAVETTWLKKGKIYVKESKSSHIMFTLRKAH